MFQSPLAKMIVAGLCLGGLSCQTIMAQEEAAEGGQEAMRIQMAVDNESGAGPIVISSAQMMFAGEGEGGESSFQIFSGGDFGGDWIPGGAAVNPLSLLGNESVRAELEMVGDQLDKYRDAEKELQNQISEKAKSLAGGKLNPMEMGDIAKQIAELQKNKQQRLESMLLPHQLERLKQVALQIQMKKRGAASTLLSDAITEELGIDSEQKKRIEEREKELKKELAERMAKLKEEIRGKLLNELTAQQQKKLKEISGDDFDYQPTSLNQQIQQRLNRRMKSRIGG